MTELASESQQNPTARVYCESHMDGLANLDRWLVGADVGQLDCPRRDGGTLLFWLQEFARLINAPAT